MTAPRQLPPDEQALWDDYLRTHSDADRNALYEHYLPWVVERATMFAHKHGVPDPENFVSDQVLLLGAKFIPYCSCSWMFKPYVAVAMRNNAMNYYRRHRESELFEREPVARTSCQVCSMLESLPPQEAAVLWLRHCRRNTLAEIAASFGLSLSQAKRVSAMALKKLRKIIKGELEE